MTKIWMEPWPDGHRVFMDIPELPDAYKGGVAFYLSREGACRLVTELTRRLDDNGPLDQESVMGLVIELVTSP